MNHRYFKDVDRRQSQYFCMTGTLSYLWFIPYLNKQDFHNFQPSPLEPSFPKSTLTNYRAPPDTLMLKFTIQNVEDILK